MERTFSGAPHSLAGRRRRLEEASPWGRGPTVQLRSASRRPSPRPSIAYPAVMGATRYAVMAINKRTNEKQMKPSLDDRNDALAEATAVREILDQDIDEWDVHVVEMKGDAGAGRIIEL